MLANGMLAGLVAITASCSYVNSISAVIIGLAAGLIVVMSVVFFENTLKIDDPVGAISVHGVGGLWGIIALGLFADGSYGAGINGVAGNVRGLFYGDASQLTAELIAAGSCIVFVFGSFFLFFKVVGAWIGNRVSAAVEYEGLDVSEMGTTAYPDFVTTPSVSLTMAPSTAQRQPLRVAQRGAGN